MNIISVMMLSCLKVTELIEMKEQIPLGFLKTLQLRIHTNMCSGCRNYMKHSRLINQLLKKNLSAVSVMENTDDLETAIISKLL